MAERRIGVSVCWVSEPAPGQATTPEQGARAAALGWRAFELAAGSTVTELLAHPELAALADRVHRGELAVAVYGRAVEGATVLHDGDRVELLAALLIDPKAARAARVRHQSAAKKRDAH